MGLEYLYTYMKTIKKNQPMHFQNIVICQSHGSHLGLGIPISPGANGRFRDLDLYPQVSICTSWGFLFFFWFGFVGAYQTMSERNVPIFLESYLIRTSNVQS